MNALILISGLLNILLALWLWSLIRKNATARGIIRFQRKLIREAEKR